MSPEEQNESDTKRVEDAINSLGDHFDSVQIFVTRHEPAAMNGTVTLARGAGNWFARAGQVRSWINMQDEHDRDRARKEANL